MQLSVLLSKDETDKVKNHDSLFIKALMALVKKIQDRVKVEVPILGTKNNGDIFKIKIE